MGFSRSFLCFCWFLLVFSRGFEFFLGVFYEFFMFLLVLLVVSMNFLGVLSFF